MRVNFSDKPKPKEPLYPETEHKLFVGNLAWTVTSESLTQAFQAYGDLVGARVLYDGETGKSRGYGFVCYATRAELEAAIEAMNGVVLDYLFFINYTSVNPYAILVMGVVLLVVQELEGRAMRVSLAQGKTQ